MADPRADRNAYLDRIATDLRLPPESTTDVVDELRAHLDAAVVDLEAESLDRSHAEREAIARLGDPTTLAVGIRRARQTRRRLFVAAGYGALAGMKGAAWGYLFAFAVVTLAAVASSLLIVAVMSLLEIHAYQYTDVTAWLTLPYALLASGYAGHRVPAAVARRSDRRVAAVRIPAALLGGIAVGAVALFWIPLDMDPGLALVLASAPVAFVVGALLVRDDANERSARISLGWRSIGLLVGASALALSLVTLATAQPAPQTGPGTKSPPTDGAWAYPPASVDLAPAVEIELADTAFTETVAFDEALPAGWQDLRLEVWPSDVNGIPTPGVTAPTLVVPYAQTAEGPWTYSATVDRPATTTPTFFQFVSTALEPDGERVLVTGPDIVQTAIWNGTLWEYLTQRP